MMVEFVMLVLGVSLFLYTVLGGADFGAGIVEIFIGKKGVHTISKAMAPVWEANHVWLILVIVLVFNGFPKVYSTLSTVLHIPLMGILVGIIFRGTAFTFRHYDVLEDSTHKYYDFFFRISSLLTPMFLGMTLGAMIGGRISIDYTQDFYSIFIAPWFNWFSFSLGIFTTTLFAYIASVFLVGEVETENGKNTVIKFAQRALVMTMVMGGLVMLTAEWEGLNLFHEFISHPLSLTSSILGTLLIPIIFILIKKEKIVWMRLATGAQVAIIMIGWAVVQFPVFIQFQDGTTFSMYNCAAPNSTFRQMVIALIVGLLIVIPAFLYLFKIFKMKKVA